MANKQCTIYIIDQGKSMGEKHNGRDESNLDFGMRYIWDKIGVTMTPALKTWTIGVIGLRTNETKNPLADEEGYANISILKEAGPMYMPDLRRLQDQVEISSTNRGDAISSVVVAVEMIEQYTKKLKYQRKIVLMTDGRGFLDADDIHEIAKKINECNIELVVIGIDFDDAEYGFKEEDKDPSKANSEALLRKLVDDCDNGTFGTMAEAVDALAIPVVKQTKPYSTFKGKLTLGNPEKYETAMAIDVERYFRTKRATNPTASSFATQSNLSNQDASQPTLKSEEDGLFVGIDDGQGGDLTSVKQERSYKVVDTTAPGGKRDVNPTELAKGYEYGRTAVHISQSDENVTKLETKAGLEIIGFIPRDNYEAFFNMGESCVTIAQQVNEKAKMALSSLIHALHELESCAVARIIVKEGKDPKLILMFPSIEPDLECLIDIPLPFAEDVRTYRFPPLDRVITIAGTILTTHRYIPTDALSDAMSAYVDSMDLSAFGKDDEGNSTEYMPIEETYAPTIHRLNQAVRNRAVRPNVPISPPAPVLVQFSYPPPELVEVSKSKLDKLIAVADVKKVPAKAKGKRTRDTIKPLSGLDVDALLNNSGAKRKKIDVNNAVPEFKQMLASNKLDDFESIQDAAKQMAELTRSLISSSTGSSAYSRALENIRVMREELVELEQLELYDDFIKDLKKKLLAGELGGDRREFFFEIRAAKLGLITKDLLDVSEVTEEQAKEFYSVKSALAIR